MKFTHLKGQRYSCKFLCPPNSKGSTRRQHSNPVRPEKLFPNVSKWEQEFVLVEESIDKNTFRETVD